MKSTELGKILWEMYDKSPHRNQVVNIHLSGGLSMFLSLRRIT